jgi:ribose transport system ATP-binding protein
MDSLLSLQGITKVYPGVRALDDVSFFLQAGEIHCLVGENGAGKSTLMKILAGAQKPDDGSILISGGRVEINSPSDAQRRGIGVIYQDFKLVTSLSVAENISLGHEPVKNGFLDKKRMNDEALVLLSQLGEEIDPTIQVGYLSIAKRQIVEIAKAMSRKVRILAFDEPTAPLTGQEIGNLFKVIRKLAAEGVGIIYISHRLEEIFEIGDRVTVLRDGRNVSTNAVADVDRRTLIRYMVGRDLENEYPKIVANKGKEILRLEHVGSDRLHDINLTLHCGEVLGLAGLVGAGRTEVARLIFGADRKTEGNIFLDGAEIEPRSPHDAIASGIGLLTEDRNRLGLVLSMNVRENITLAMLDTLTRKGLIRDSQERDIADRYVEELQVKPPNSELGVATLSGGNRQKVVLARWLSTQARVMMFDEPTAGVDVGAKYEIYSTIGKLAQEGKGILVISSDLPELLGICDRVAVLCEGRVTGILPRAEATQENIMALATQGVHLHG